jgi:hypothetical protein
MVLELQIKSGPVNKPACIGKCGAWGDGASVLVPSSFSSQFTPL